MICDTVLMKFQYHWLYIPTGGTGICSAHFFNRLDFLEHLAKWNRDPRWKYWEI